MTSGLLRRLTMPMREPGYPPEDAKEAVDILTTLKWLSEADIMVGSELADAALDDAALALWKCGLLDDLVTRASKFHWPT
jgi:hypothetical protein